MHNKLLNTIFNISAIILFPSALWGLIYEIFIFDKFVIPDKVYNITMAIGYLSLFGLLFSAVLDRIINKYKERKQYEDDYEDKQRERLY